MRFRLLFALLLIFGLVAAACGDDDDESTAEPTAAETGDPTATTDAGSETPEPETPTAADVETPDSEAGETFPLTGRPIDDPEAALRPALATKMDNIADALPQAGIADADVIVEVLVEGRLTRLIPVWHSVYPDTAGPIRSARSSDPDILANFNAPLFSWWGAMDVVKGEVAAGESAGKLIDMSIDNYPSLYYRIPRDGVAVEHTGFTNPPDLLAQAPDDAEPPFQFAEWLGPQEENRARAEEVPGMQIDWGNILVEYAWSAEDEAWLRWEWGVPHTDTEGQQVAVQNVVVLDTPYGRSAAKASSPQALTVGSSNAVVYTNGKRIKGTWTRDSANEPWQLFDGAGRPLKLARGQTLVELTDRRTILLSADEAQTLLSTRS